MANQAAGEGIMNLLGAAMVAGAYLLGSIPFGLLITRLMGGPDPRHGGSGNIGATNVTRLAGRAAGVATLFLDAAKGAVPMALALAYLPPWPAAAVGLAAFLGHLYPLYLGFKGGKGVATALGVLATASPLTFLATLGVLVLAAWWSGHVSVGSMAGCASAPIWLMIWGQSPPLTFMALAMALMVIWRHRANIVRLRQGSEHGWR
ncbi:MAG: glycerol-3-phosphate 1-O-acyltransferase PlsY [Pseudomonadota bacterium]